MSDREPHAHPTPLHPDLPSREAEAIARPTPIKQAIPFVAASLILWWVLRGVDFAAVAEAIRRADMARFVPASLAFTLAFVFSEVFGFGSAYGWFNAPVTFREKLYLRVGTLPFQAVIGPLSLVGVLTYLWRRHRCPPLQVIGSNAMMAVTDSLVFVTFIGSALVIGGAEISGAWRLLCAGIALGELAFFTYWYTDLRNRILPNFERNGLLRSISRARPHHWAKLYAARSVMMAANVAGNFVALRAFGVEVPFATALWAMPLVLGSAFLPISVGGFGGPQAAAVYFFRPYGTEEAIVACSLLWSTAFLIGRLGLGFTFFRPLWRGAFGEK